MVTAMAVRYGDFDDAAPTLRPEQYNRPRDRELIVFERAPRRSAIVEGEVYRAERIRGQAFRFVLAASISTGYARFATVDARELDRAQWRPATIAEREAVFD